MGGDSVCLNFTGGARKNYINSCSLRFTATRLLKDHSASGRWVMRFQEMQREEKKDGGKEEDADKKEEAKVGVGSWMSQEQDQRE